MNAGYARTYVDFWTGPTAIRLARCGDEGARSLAHFLFSGPNCDAWGLYRKPLEVLVHEFKRPDTGEFAKAERDVRRALSMLEEVDYAAVDEENAFIWVKEMAAHQFKPLPWKPTNLLIKSARRWYANVGRNRFLGAYFDRYDLDLHLSNTFAFAGTEVQRREWTPPLQQVALIDVKPLAAARPVLVQRKVETCGEAEFADWWAHYPAHRRKARKAALGIWLRKRIARDQLPLLIAKLDEQKRSRDWRKGAGQYVPLPTTYLTGERYDDESAEMAYGGLNPTNEVTADTLRELMEEIPDE